MPEPIIGERASTDALVAAESVALEPPLATAGSARAPAGWRSARYWLHRPGLVISVLVVAVAILWAVVPGLFTSSDPLVGVPADRLQSPSASHLFGTDQLGRDVYTRVVYGARDSLSAAAIAVAIALVVGSALGLVSGYWRGRVDDVIMRLVDVVLAIPALLLALAVITALGFGTLNVAIAVGVVNIAVFTRLMRSEVLRVRAMAYVEAAQCSGLRPVTVMARHVLPNSWGPVLVLATLEFGTALLIVSALSFLGFGTPPPAPEWGALVSAGRLYITTAWWMIAIPGLVIAVVVLAVNRISRALGGDGA